MSNDLPGLDLQPPKSPEHSDLEKSAISVVDLLVPTNPLAAVSCWLGVFSLLLCITGPVLGPIAVIIGWFSFGRGGPVPESRYGAMASNARSIIGIITGVLSTVIGAFFLWLFYSS